MRGLTLVEPICLVVSRPQHLSLVIALNVSERLRLLVCERCFGNLRPRGCSMPSTGGTIVLPESSCSPNSGLPGDTRAAACRWVCQLSCALQRAGSSSLTYRVQRGNIQVGSSLLDFLMPLYKLAIFLAFLRSFLILVWLSPSVNSVTSDSVTGCTCAKKQHYDHVFKACNPLTSPWQCPLSIAIKLRYKI